MKKIAVLLGFIMVSSCSSTRFVDSWKNKEITSFQPQKLLVIGMTDNLTGRKIFEEKLKRAFINYGINTFESSEVLEKSFTDTRKSEEEIDDLKDKLLADGFDSVVITAIIGVDEKREYNSGYYTFGYNWYRFGRYYYRFQDVYYLPEYYDDYKVYHIETSIYKIKEDEDKSLVWVGTFDIVDPHNISSTVSDYVERIMTQLEREGVVK